jgi:hypothetical protein
MSLLGLRRLGSRRSEDGNPDRTDGQLRSERQRTGGGQATRSAASRDGSRAASSFEAWNHPYESFSERVRDNERADAPELPHSTAKTAPGPDEEPVDRAG